MANITNETAFFEACESNEINTAIFLLRYVDVSSLKKWRTCGGRTCFHVVVVAGSSDLLRELAAKLGLEADLFDREDDDGETPLSMAVGLGLVEAVELLITRTSNALHLVAELNQVKLVQILSKNNVVDLSKLIDQPYQPVQSATKNKNKTEGKRLIDPSDDEEDNSVTNFQPIRGDTPLHIAVKNKYEHMVNLLLNIPGVKKDARNSNGKTALQIAREVTGYHESFRIIRKLADCEGRQKPFMYCAPQVSHKKHMEASKMVNKAFEDRRNTELVVAALLATMTFTAAFTVPGGFQTDEKQREELGSPVLISFTSFKLFLVFDCTAFFLSLFVCIMWQMSSELTTEDKTFFLTVTGLLVCGCFGFTAYGFMAAVYTMLAHKSMTFTWVVLGNLIAITLCGILAFIHQSVKFIMAQILLKMYGLEQKVVGFLSVSVQFVILPLGLQTSVGCLRAGAGAGAVAEEEADANMYIAITTPVVRLRAPLTVAMCHGLISYRATTITVHWGEGPIVLFNFARLTNNRSV